MADYQDETNNYTNLCYENMGDMKLNASGKPPVYVCQNYFSFLYVLAFMYRKQSLVLRNDAGLTEFLGRQ